MREQHVIERADGARINIEDWIATKDSATQEDWHAANRRKKGIRQSMIDQGYMVIDQTSSRRDYVWSNTIPEGFRPPNDPVWESYFQQFLQETEQTCVIKFIDD
jgi:hypothetical protein